MHLPLRVSPGKTEKMLFQGDRIGCKIRDCIAGDSSSGSPRASRRHLVCDLDRAGACGCIRPSWSQDLRLCNFFRLPDELFVLKPNDVADPCRRKQWFFSVRSHRFHVFGYNSGAHHEEHYALSYYPNFLTNGSLNVVYPDGKHG